MGVRLSGLIAVVAVVALVTSYGRRDDDLSAIVIVPRPSTTTTMPTFTAPPPPVPAVRTGPVGVAAVPASTFSGTWVPATGNLTGMASECGNVGMASVPADDLFVAGVARHGLWRVAPGTTDWSALGQGGDQITNRVLSLVVDPEHPTTFWESGPYGDGGVFRTDDGGLTFERQGTVTQTDYLSVDFTDPARRTVLAGAHEAAVLYRSTDGGATWSEVPNLPADLGYASSPYVIDAQTLLLGTSDGVASGIFRSADGGATWLPVFVGPVVGAPVVQADGTILWLQQGGGGIVSSTDGGLTWTEHGARGAIARTAVQMIGLPDGSLVTFGDRSLVESVDGGGRWVQFGPALPYTPNNVAYAAGEGVFYVSRFDCSFTDDNPVKPDAIMRLVPD